MTNYRINGFDQMKAFFKMVFNSQKKIRPTHVSLYMFLLNQNNRCGWNEWFKIPYDTGMTGSCIGSRKTYYKTLRELKEIGVIDYIPGINENKSPMVKIIPISIKPQENKQVEDDSE